MEFFKLVLLLACCNFATIAAAKDCSNGAGKCVPVTQCKSKEVNKTLPLIDKRSDSYECNHYLEVCCAIKDCITEEEGQSVIVKNLNDDHVDQCIQQCRADKPFTSPNEKPTKPDDAQKLSSLEYNCGYSNPEGVGFSVPHETGESESTNAQFGEFPWHLALIEILGENERKYLCGASLINPYVALTAAHCVENVHTDKLIVRAGEWDTQTTNEPFPHTNHIVKSTVIHHHFNSTNLHNDIALIFLEEPVKLTAHINTICLPTADLKVDENTECYGTGWGVDEFFMTGYFRANLKKVKLPIVNKGNCQKLLRSTKLGSTFKLDSSFMCAGAQKKQDLCSGDGGGPLHCRVANKNNIFVQMGMSKIICKTCILIFR